MCICHSADGARRWSCGRRSLLKPFSPSTLCESESGHRGGNATLNGVVADVKHHGDDGRAAVLHADEQFVGDVVPFL
jgi:hypothetical protein